MSLQLRASEPSVRRAAVPFGKMNRPFGTGATGIPGNGTASENLVPREVAPIQEPGQSGAQESQPFMESVPTASAAVDSQSVGDLTSASDVSEIASAPDWEFTPARHEAASTYESVVSPPQETPTFSETAAPLEAPVTFEAPAPIEAMNEPASFETSEFFETVGEPIEIPRRIVVESAITPAPVDFSEATMEPVAQGQPIPYQVPSFSPESFETVSEPISIPVETVAESAPAPTAEVFEAETEPVAQSQPIPYQVPSFSPESFETVSEPISVPSEAAAESAPAPTAEAFEAETEPVAQSQPIPYQVPAFSTDSTMTEITQPEPESHPTHLSAETIAVAGSRPLVESPSFAPQIISTEHVVQQPTTPATMPESTQQTTAPAIRTPPMTGGVPQSQPASGMHTAVQLTFSFEIASMQLTPSFKMGALQLKPTSKIVTMRLAPSQQPQPAMNLQVTFEIATVQVAGNSIGMIRLTPSQQQRPGVISSPAFSVAGLQLLSGAETGAVQITPSQQGQASVHVTGRFQIATVEFSPSFEIASIVLNATSKNVSVQLPGAGPSAVEGAPVFEITNVQLAGNGEIGMMQLIAQGAVPKSA